MWAGLAIAVSVVVTIAVVVWFGVSDKHPESAASHSDEHPDTPAERFYGPHPSGPAGPDAESQRPDDTGNTLMPRHAM